MPRFLIAFDKFKNALTAGQACSLTAEVLSKQYPHAEIDVCPFTDGGEGFGEILTTSAGGLWHKEKVTGPRGHSIGAGFGLVAKEKIPFLVADTLPSDKSLAIIEMASASGLAGLLPDQRDPWQTHTGGVGELILAATKAGAEAILLGIGGSATNDLGLGALEAMGLQALDKNGQQVTPPIPLNWSRIHSFAGSIPDNLPPLFIACDVDNPLLGKNGATAIYGPQKGLRADDVGKMDTAAARIAALLVDHFQQPADLMETPGAGAAGGLAFGLLAATGARLIPGADLVFAWLNVASRIEQADWLITGEGRFDASSLSGKGPGRLATTALRMGKRVQIFVGAVEENLPLPDGIRLQVITPEDCPLDDALRKANVFLKKTVAETDF